MSFSIPRTLTFAALAAFASTGLMQAAQATFHLPVTAHWGQTVLAPGDYKLYLPDLSSGEMNFLVRGAGQSAYETPLIASASNVSSSSYLKLQEIEGNYFVREFSSGATGADFTFAVPKANHRGAKGISLAVAAK